MEDKKEFHKLLLENNTFFTEISHMLTEGHTVTLRAKGNSMFPFITGERDSVVLQKQKEIYKGDIVLAYIPEKTYVLHRVYRIKDDTVILMGDGNVYAMEKCSKKDIQGTVLKIMRNGRTVCCNSPTERCKVWFWQLLRPLWRYILAACRQWIKWKGK